MQRLFFGIYGAILASTLLLLALSYFALTSYNQYRYQTHLASVMHGTSYLLSRGVARQEPENRERWIALAASLLDSQIKLENSPTVVRHQYEVIAISEENSQSEKYRVFSQLADSEQRLVLEFEGVTESILSATAFFMLNELGRTPPDERQAFFDQLKDEFDYELLRIPQSDLDLDSRQLERLQRGETVVAVKRQFGQGLAFNVYAPWGKTSDALVMGPVQFFDPFPGYIAASVLASALLFMALLVMLLIRKLSKRLIALQHKVDAIGSTTPAADENSLNEANAEVITGLSNKIQSMTQRIEKLLAEKAYMIRAVSHDLRTPIAKIHFRLEALTEQVNPGNKAIVGIQNDLRQLNLLIDELLTFEKLSEKQNIEFQPLDLQSLLSEQIEGVRLIYPRLQFHLQGQQPGDIQANEVLLKRLIENLLNNAGRYANTQVSVEVQQTQDNVIVVVDDDGPGLGDVDTKMLFEPFFKTDASRTTGKGGYGLGLAIVRQVAMQHSGKIEASNKATGGASFILTLPIRQNQS